MRRISDRLEKFAGANSSRYFNPREEVAQGQGYLARMGGGSPQAGRLAAKIGPYVEKETVPPFPGNPARGK